MHRNSYRKMEWFKNTYLHKSNKLDILDVGSLDGKGTFNYSTLFNETNWTYTGLDIEGGNNVQIIVTDIYNSYDVIISGQFFEHLEFFWLAMIQIERVLKPGGYLCIIVPSAGPNHGGDMPNCYRFHEDGLKAMAKYVDLEVLHASVDNRSEANPWNDACLVARKRVDVAFEKSNLEERVNNLENKLDLILDTIKNK